MSVRLRDLTSRLINLAVEPLALHACRSSCSEAGIGETRDRGHWAQRGEDKSEYRTRDEPHRYRCDDGCDGEHHEHTLPAEEDGKEDKHDDDENRESGDEGDERNVRKPE